MLKNLPLKKKYILTGLTALMLLVSYRVAFRPTIDAWQINRELEKQLATSSEVIYQPGYMERKTKNIDEVLARYKVDTVAFRNNVISTVSIMAEKEHVKLMDVPVMDANHITERALLQKLNFEGDFFSLTKLVHQLETAENIGFVRSVNYKMLNLHSGSQNREKLILDVFLEISR